jgi:hypothetical protein
MNKKKGTGAIGAFGGTRGETLLTKKGSLLIAEDPVDRDPVR